MFFSAMNSAAILKLLYTLKLYLEIPQHCADDHGYTMAGGELIFLSKPSLDSSCVGRLVVGWMDYF
jgi:hypothetical protein